MLGGGAAKRAPEEADAATAKKLRALDGAGAGGAAGGVEAPAGATESKGTACTVREGDAAAHDAAHEAALQTERTATQRTTATVPTESARPSGAAHASAGTARGSAAATPSAPKSHVDTVIDGIAPSLIRDSSHYELVGTLGSGTFGEVVHMRRKVAVAGDHFTDVAVKLAKCTEFGEYLSYEEELLKELLVYRRMACPKDEEGWRPVIRFLGLFTAMEGKPRLALVLEKYGVGLNRVLAERPPEFDAEARRTVARHVAAACRFLHEACLEGLTRRGIVHRDIKPHNVLVDKAHGYAAKLTDMGTGRLVAVMGQSNTHAKTRGTLAWMAPEILKRQGTLELAPAADVWSYGILLYDLYSGRVPGKWYECPSYRTLYHGPAYEDVDSALLMHMDAGGRPTWPAATPVAVPESVRALMPRCLDADAAKRPTFRMICAELQRTRARLVVRYAPQVARGADIVVDVELHFVDALAGTADDAGADDDVAAGESGSGSEPRPDAQGRLRLEFVVAAREGDTCSLVVGPVSSDVDGWLSGTRCELGPPLPALQPHVRPVRAGQLRVTPDWSLCAEHGVRSALKMTWQRLCAAPDADDAALPPPPERMSSSLGSLALRLALPPVKRTFSRSPSGLRRIPDAAAVARPDVMISYRDTETGFNGSRWSLETLVPGLEAAGYTCFCYALQRKKGDHWCSVLTDGIQACRAFIPVCSPTYADLGESPWTSNELFHAARTAEQRRKAKAAAEAAGASAAGCADVAEEEEVIQDGPVLIPLWHSGAFPPPDTAAILAPLAHCRVPRGEPAEALLRRGEGDEVLRLLLQALKEAGVQPSQPPAAARC